MFNGLEPGVITQISGENLLKKIKESTQDKVILNKALLSLSEVIDICEKRNDDVSDFYIFLTPSSRSSKLFATAVYRKNNTDNANNIPIPSIFRDSVVLKAQLSEVKKALISK